MIQQDLNEEQIPSRDLDDTGSLDDMSFERHHHQGSLTSVNSTTTTYTTDSSESGCSTGYNRVSRTLVCHRGWSINSTL